MPEKKTKKTCIFQRHGIQVLAVGRQQATSHAGRWRASLGELALTASEISAFRQFGYRLEYSFEEVDELPTNEIGESGVRYSAGLPRTEDTNAEYRAAIARGSGSNHGTYHQAWLTSTTYRRAWGNIVQALATGTWQVKPAHHEDMTEAEVALAEEQALFCSSALLENLEGGWSKFVREWCYQLIGGNTIFERVYHGDGEKLGAIRKLAFRYPSTVRAWIFDEHQHGLLGVQFRRHHGADYVLPASHLLIDAWDQFGDNFEGVSPLRTVASWIQFINLMLQLQALAAEKFGVPWVFVDQEPHEFSSTNTDQRELLVEILDDAAAEDAPVVALPDGTRVQVAGGVGQMPDFTSAIRLAMERVAEILRAEGSLIGLGSTGAYAARESASADLKQYAPYFGAKLCELINGANNLAHTGLIKSMVDARWGEPARGMYPTLDYSIGHQADSARVELINACVQAGTITPTRDVENAVRLELKLDPISEEEFETHAHARATGEPRDPATKPAATA